MFDPLLEERFDVSVREPVDCPFAIAAKRHQIPVAQQAKLVADRRRAHARDRSQIADAELTRCEREQDTEPGGIGERREDVGRCLHASRAGKRRAGSIDRRLVDHGNGAGIIRGSRVI